MTKVFRVVIPCVVASVAGLVLFKYVKKDKKSNNKSTPASDDSKLFDDLFSPSSDFSFNDLSNSGSNDTVFSSSFGFKDNSLEEGWSSGLVGGDDDFDLSHSSFGSYDDDNDIDTSDGYDYDDADDFLTNDFED